MVVAERVKSPAPIQLGEPIPNTRLMRRFERRREISPCYVGRQATHAPACEEAFEDADKIGERVVYVLGFTYVKIGGQWYVWG